jgi:hypothetical protein
MNVREEDLVRAFRAALDANDESYVMPELPDRVPGPDSPAQRQLDIERTQEALDRLMQDD